MRGIARLPEKDRRDLFTATAGTMRVNQAINPCGFDILFAVVWSIVGNPE